MDFNRSGATRAVTLNILKALDRIWHVGHLKKVRSYRILCLEFGLVSSFLSNRWPHVILNGKYLQEYPVIGGVFQGSILDPTLFMLYINDLPDDLCFL